MNKAVILCLPAAFSQFTFNRYIEATNSDNCLHACLIESDCDCFDFNLDTKICKLKVNMELTSHGTSACLIFNCVKVTIF